MKKKCNGILGYFIFGLFLLLCFIALIFRTEQINEQNKKELSNTQIENVIR